MIRSKFFKICIWLILGQLIIQPILTYAWEDGDRTETYGEFAEPNNDDDSKYDPSSAATEYFDDSIPEDDQVSIEPTEISAYDAKDLKSQISPTVLSIDENKIILNGVDKQKINQLSVAYSALPKLELEVEELSAVSGKSVDELLKLQQENVDSFLALAQEQTKKISNDTFIREKLIANPELLAKYLDIEVGEAIDMLENERDFLIKEVDYELGNSIDIRIIKTLNYLVRPINLGGAGHYKIKVERITKNYDSERKKGEREDIAIRDSQENGKTTTNKEKSIESIRADKTEVDNLYDPTDSMASTLVNNSQAVIDIVNAEGKTTANVLIGDHELEPETVSSHFSGQAVDISEIDDIKCTLIEKKRIGSDKKTPQAPQPIKLLYQTKAGYNADKDKIDASYNQMFMSASQSALENMFAGLNLDVTDISNQEINNFSDIAEAIGKSVFGQTLDAPLKDIWNNNLSDIIRLTGGAALADRLGLPREPFLDGSIESVEELTEALGRSYLEHNLNLPYGALAGENRDDILINIGRSRIAQELRLPTDTFSVETANSQELNNRIGSRIIEYEFGFPAGSFWGKDNMSDLLASGGRNRIDSFFKNPDYVDGKLGLPKGTTSGLRSGSIAIKDYVSKVSGARLLRSVYAYPNYSGGSGCNWVGNINSGHEVCTNNQATVGDKSNWRDEMMNLPEGTIDTFLSNGDIGVIKDKLKAAGISTLVKNIEKNDTSRNRLTKWLNSPTDDFTIQDQVTENDQPVEKRFCLPISSYAAATKLDSLDFFKVFGQGDNTRGIFKRVGKSLMSYGLKPEGKELKLEKETLSSMPKFNFPVQNAIFYTDKSTKLLDSAKNLKDVLSTGKDALNTIDDQQARARITAIQNSLEEKSVKLDEAVNKLQNITEPQAILNLNVEILNQYYAISSVLTDAIALSTKFEASNIRDISSAVYKLESVGKIAYEISVGSDESDFRFEDINIKDIKTDIGTTESGGITYIDRNKIALMLSGRVDLKSFLSSMGSSKLGSAIDLPPDALKIAASASTADTSANSSDMLMRSISLTVLEDASGLNLSKISADDLKEKVSINELVSLFSSKLNTSSNQAKSMIAKALNLGGKDLDGLINGDFRAWSGARASAEENDIKMRLPKGTTENFIKNQSLGRYDSSLVSKKELVKLSDAIGVSEPALKTFMAKKEGANDPKYNKIYFKSYVPETNDASTAKKLVNAYFYQDKNGIHEFESYNNAEKYRLAHTNDEQNYLDEIASAISNKLPALGDASNVRNKLSAFLDNKIRSAFGESSQTLENSLYNLFGIDRSATRQFFSRSGSDNSIGAVDFLKILGSRYLAKEVMPQINSDMDIKSGFSTLDGYDLLKILNGEGREALSTAGAYLTDKEMGTTPGTILRLILTNDEQEREALIKENAFELLGKALGISGVDFSNTNKIAQEFGLNKIEKTLKLTNGTFRGNTIDEVIENATASDLVKSFSLPISDDLRNLATDIINKINPAGKNSANASFADQISMINTYKQSNAFENISSNERGEINNLEKGTRNIAKSVLKNSNLLDEDSNAASTALRSQIEREGGKVSSDLQLGAMIEEFRAQINSIESSLKLNPKTLIQSFQGQAGLSIDSIITDVSRSVLKNDGQNSLGTLVANVLGVGNKNLTADSIGNIINDLAASLNNETGASFDLDNFNTFLDNLFTSNFDDKAHFSFGTFKSIFQNAGDTALRLLEQGLSTLDGQFGTTDDESKNMRKFANIAISSLGSDWSSLLTSASDVSATLNSSIIPTSGSSISIQGIADNIATTAYNSIVRETGVIENITQTINGVTNTIEQTVNSISNIADMSETLISNFQDIFAGDFRPLQVIGILNNIPGIVGKECTRQNGQLGTCLSVPNNVGFLFNVDNIFASVFGTILSNPGAEDRVALKAAEWMGEMTAAHASDTNGAENSLTDDNVISQGVFGDTNSSALPTFDNPRDPNSQPGSQYAEEYANAHYPTTGSASPQPASGTPEFDFLQSKVLFAEALGRVNFQESLGKLFQFKTMDCSLFKNNPLIPSGFARALFDGNAFDKINTLQSFLGSWMNTDGALGKLNQIFGTDVNPRIIIDMFNDHGGFDIQTAADSLGLSLETFAGKLDKLILDNAPTIMGVNLGSGIGGSMMAFIKTRDLSASFGEILQSFKDKFSIGGSVGMITNWGDQQLGLPAGTLQSLYNNVIGVEAAQFSFAGASLAGPYAAIASILFQKIKGYVVGFVMNMATKIVGAVEAALGLVPGSLMALIMAGFSPVGLAAFVIQNLFGVYKILLVCTADGYYPGLESPPDDSVWDNGRLGTFDGLNSKAREAYYIKAAQYKADRLIKDLLRMPYATKDENLVPVQIMTGRIEDVEENTMAVSESICPKVGSSGVYSGSAICKGWNSRSGLSSNPQTTAWMHIGF